jgi:hypothetical protein
MVALTMLTRISYGQGKLLNKMLAKVAKSAGNASTVTTSTLDNVVPTVGVASNLYPVELGTISQSFFPGWKTGGDQVFLMFTKKNDPGFYKIDGTVTIDGAPVEYVTSGMYSMITDPNAAPRKIEITTSAGQKSSFTVQPSARKIKVIAINGQKDNISIDLSKDVTLELEGSGIENSLLKISLAINQVSIKSIYEVCHVRAGSKVVIPAAAFRNINIKPAGSAVYGYKNSFLEVCAENIENASNVSGSFPSVSYTSYAFDGKFVTVTAEPNLNTGLVYKDNQTGTEYDLFKPGAFLSRPFSQIKKIGITSFSIRGTTYHQTSQSSSTTSSRINPFGGASTTTTVATITVTKEFPYEAVLESLYPELVAILESEFSATVLPVEKITGSAAYQSMDAFSKDDESTKVEFAKTYRNTKVISAFMPVTEGFGVNGINQRILNDVGADALVTLTLDLDTQEGPNNQVYMMPKFGFEISGKTNGNTANTKFASGNIKLPGIVFNSKDATAEYLADAVIRKSVLLNAFRKGLQELKAKEKANGDYDVVWNLQK